MGSRIVSLAALAAATFALAGCPTTAGPGTCAANVTACASDVDCGGFQCTAGCCSTDRLCDDDSDCPDSGTFCNSGVCGPREAVTCASSRDCRNVTDALICDLAGARCVQCLSNNDCSTNGSRICNAQKRCEPKPGGCGSDLQCTEAGRGKCKIAERVCVECLNTGDCISGSGNVCTANRCVPPPARCTSSAQCLAGTPYCHVGSGTCVACLEPGQCGAGRTCEGNACVAAPDCADDAGCAEGRCHVASRTCVECLGPSDCPDATYTCNATTRACEPGQTGCDDHGDCASRPGATKCLVSTGACVACVEDGHCTAGNRCTNNACVPIPAGCTGHTDCRANPAAQLCQTSTGRCVACLQGTDCTSSGRCDTAAGSCLGGCAEDRYCGGATPNCRVDTHTCVACLDDGGCGPGTVCTNNACVAGCTDGGDCSGATDVCDTATRTCVQCLTSADCTSGATCTQKVCVAPQTGGIGQPCATGDECTDANAICWPGTTNTCRRLCDPYAAACGTGEACQWFSFDIAGEPVGACLPETLRGAAGASCQDDGDCELDLLCVPTSATTGRCSAYCDPAGSTVCGAADECRELPALFDANASTPAGYLLTIGACVPALSDWGVPCRTDYGPNGAGSFSSDCAGGLTCGPNIPLIDDSVRLSYCQYPFGSGEADTTCTDGSGCRTGDCLQGPQVCNTSCHWTSDCNRAGLSSLYRCVPYLWEAESVWTGETHYSTTGACLPTCRSSAGCADPGSFCMLTTTFENSGDFESSFQSYCYPKRGTAGGPNRAAGARCRLDGECASGLCLTNGTAGATDGYCSGVCDQRSTATGQCDPANGVVCDPSGVGLYLNVGRDGVPGTGDDAAGRAFVCSGKRCGANADCAGTSADSTRPRACALTYQASGPNTAYGATLTLRTTCEPAVGRRAAGASCTLDEDCASNECIEFASGPKLCYGPCRGNGDCASGSRCQSEFDFGIATLSACVPSF